MNLYQYDSSLAHSSSSLQILLNSLIHLFHNSLRYRSNITGSHLHIVAPRVLSFQVIITNVSSSLKPMDESSILKRYEEHNLCRLLSLVSKLNPGPFTIKTYLARGDTYSHISQLITLNKLKLKENI